MNYKSNIVYTSDMIETPNVHLYDGHEIHDMKTVTFFVTKETNGYAVWRSDRFKFAKVDDRDLLIRFVHESISSTNFERAVTLVDNHYDEYLSTIQEIQDER